MESKNAFVASKMMLDFIRDFTKLNEAQLLGIRRLMQDTVGQVMQLIMDINAVTDEPAVAKDQSQTVERFTKGLEEATLRQDRVGVLVSSLMGSVSSEDIIRQRISHVHFAVECLNSALAQLISDFDGFLTADKITHLRNVVLTNVYKSYSAEEERQIFHDIFGRPRRKAAAA